MFIVSITNYQLLKKTSLLSYSQLINVTQLYLITGHPIANMKLLEKHVIPRVCAEWETVAAYLEYTIPMKKMISRTNRGLPRECCTALLENWISSDNGVKPKTWEKLIEVLSEISSLAMVTKQIKQCLHQEAVLGGRLMICM